MTATTPEYVTRDEFGVFVLELRADRAEQRLELVDFRQEMRAGFATVAARLEQVDTRLEQVDTRLEQVDTRLEQVDARLGSLETRLDAVEADVSTLIDTFADFRNDYQQHTHEPEENDEE